MDADANTLELERRLQQLEHRVTVVEHGLEAALSVSLDVAAAPYRHRAAPAKPPEPQLRIIKEGHIPHRTDGHVSWWKRLFAR